MVSFQVPSSQTWNQHRWTTTGHSHGCRSNNWVGWLLSLLLPSVGVRWETRFLLTHWVNVTFCFRSPGQCGRVDSPAETHCDALPSRPCCPSSVHGASDFQVSCPDFDHLTRVPRFWDTLCLVCWIVCSSLCVIESCKHQLLLVIRVLEKKVSTQPDVHVVWLLEETGPQPMQLLHRETWANVARSLFKTERSTTAQSLSLSCYSYVSAKNAGKIKEMFSVHLTGIMFVKSCSMVMKDRCTSIPWPSTDLFLQWRVGVGGRTGSFLNMYI